MNKVKVEICCGTACYLLGAVQLMRLEEYLSDELKGKVELEPKGCLGLCNDDKLGGAPYVRFNGTEPMSGATPDKVIARIRELLGMEEV